MNIKVRRLLVFKRRLASISQCDLASSPSVIKDLAIRPQCSREALWIRWWFSWKKIFFDTAVIWQHLKLVLSFTAYEVQSEYPWKFILYVYCFVLFWCFYSTPSSRPGTWRIWCWTSSEVHTPQYLCITLRTCVLSWASFSNATHGRDPLSEQYWTSHFSPGESRSFFLHRLEPLVVFFFLLFFSLWALSRQDVMGIKVFVLAKC